MNIFIKSYWMKVKILKKNLIRDLARFNVTLTAAV